MSASWEYQWISLNVSENLDRLNAMGASGWEAVTAIDQPNWNTILILMKRNTEAN